MSEPIPKGMKPASIHFRDIASFKKDYKRHRRLICAALHHVSSNFSNNGCIIVSTEEQLETVKKLAREMLSVDMFKKLGFKTYSKYKEFNREGEIVGFKYLDRKSVV